jgi:hypothetical protein
MKNLFIILTLLALTGMGCAEPYITEYQPATYSVSGQKITVHVYLQNTGSTLYSDWIVELQPRPVGQYPLVAATTGDYSCDPNYPENVAEGYILGAGERVTLTLETQPTPGTYDLYLLARDKCWSSPPPQGNTVTQSLGWGSYKKIGTVTTGAGTDPQCVSCTAGQQKDCSCDNTWVQCKLCNANNCWDTAVRHITWCGENGVCAGGACTKVCPAVYGQNCGNQINSCPIRTGSDGCNVVRCDLCPATGATTTTIPSSCSQEVPKCSDGKTCPAADGANGCPTWRCDLCGDSHGGSSGGLPSDWMTYGGIALIAVAVFLMMKK